MDLVFLIQLLMVVSQLVLSSINEMSTWMNTIRVCFSVTLGQKLVAERTGFSTDLR